MIWEQHCNSGSCKDQYYGLKLRIANVLTHFMPLVSFNISWKHQKTYGFLVWFSDVFKGYWKSPVAWNGLANRKKLLWFILCDLLLITSLELLTRQFFNISKCLDSIARKAHFSWVFHFIFIKLKLCFSHFSLNF